MGFADENARIPLLLEDGLIQEDGQCAYRYEWQEFYGWVQYRQLPGQDWQPILSFDLSPQVDRDFDPVLTFFACHPSSSMRNDPRVARYFPDCVMALRKHTAGHSSEENGADLGGREAGAEGAVWVGDGGDVMVFGFAEWI